MSTLKYLAGVVSLTLDGERCVGCGTCVEVCPHGVFALAGKKARIEDRDACMECGACARNCPAEAVSVEAGVGCASAVLISRLRGTEPCCDGSDGSPCCG